MEMEIKMNDISIAVNPDISITYDGVSVQKHGKEYLGLRNFKLTFTVTR